MAAGYQPVDLNNLFISSPQREHLVSIAERDGFPQNCCAWIKGIYGVLKGYGIKNVLCVTSGDCSNTVMLMEVLKLKGFNVLPFAYPDSPNLIRMRHALESLAESLGTTLNAAEEMRNELSEARKLAHRLDELTWQEGVVSGWENHLWLVTSSDFAGNYQLYQQRLSQFLLGCERRQPYPENMLRIAYIGVPSVFAEELYPYLERNGARVVFNEIQRQFAMPQPGCSLAEQYCHYTYPYSISYRLNDIVAEMERRRIDGIIHYVQAFCHRGIGDIIFRHSIKLPMLTLEGNADFTLTHHLRTRLEAFLDVVKQRSKVYERGRYVS